jgi:hypothetical protein
MSEFFWRDRRFLGLDSIEWLVWLAAVVALACVIGSTAI